MKRVDVNLKVIIAIIVLFGLSLSLMAQPQQKQQQFRQWDQRGFHMMDLTEEQETDIKEIRTTMRKEIQPLIDETKINQAKINALIHKDNPDMDEIVSLIEANGKLKTQIQVLRIESKIKVRSHLTEDQKVNFDAHERRMRGKRAMVHHRSQQMMPDRGRF